MRAGEQTVMDLRDPKLTDMEPLNLVRAASEANLPIWMKNHNVTVGDSYVVKRAGQAYSDSAVVKGAGGAVTLTSNVVSGAFSIEQAWAFARDMNASKYKGIPFMFSDEHGDYTIWRQPAPRSLESWRAALGLEVEYYKFYQTGDSAGEKVLMDKAVGQMKDDQLKNTYGYQSRWTGEWVFPDKDTGSDTPPSDAFLPFGALADQGII